jgi:predicted DNA-binding transcriptional regulator AlpA
MAMTFIRISEVLQRGVKAGKFPAPVKLSERITAWRLDDVNAWLASNAGIKKPDNAAGATGLTDLLG